MIITLVNIWAVPPGSTIPQALRFCAGKNGFVSSPSDTPPNTKWLPGLQAPYHLKREIFGTVNAGSSRTNSGEIVLIGKDNRLDAYDYQDWGFDGQKVEVFVGDENRPFSAFTQVFRGVTESVALTWDKMTFAIKDRQKELDKPIPLVPKYLGTNSGSVGIEGGPEDIKGRFKPVCFGPAPNVAPVKVNGAAQIYQVHFRSIQAISAVYSNGLAMTPGVDYADETLLKNAIIAAGSYATCLAKGLFRVNTTLGTVITADVQGDNVGGYVFTADGIMRRIMEMYGWVAGTDFSATDLAALNAKNSAPQNIFDTNGATGKTLMDQVCSGPWFWFCPSRLGLMRFGRIEAPGGAPVRTLDDTYLMDLDRVTNELAGPPWSLVTMNCERNYYPMRATEVAATVSDDSRAWLLLDYRSCPHTTDGNPDATVLSRHPLADQQVFTGTFAARVDGLAEAQRRASFRSATRRGFMFRLAMFDPQARGYSLDQGQTVALTSRRLGLSATPMTIQGIEDIPEKNQVEVTCYA